jgi:hypothetical protein
MLSKKILNCDLCKAGKIRYIRDVPRGRDWHSEITIWHELDGDTVPCNEWRDATEEEINTDGEINT